MSFRELKQDKVMNFKYGFSGQPSGEYECYEQALLTPDSQCGVQVSIHTFRPYSDTATLQTA